MTDEVASPPPKSYSYREHHPFIHKYDELRLDVTRE